MFFLLPEMSQNFEFTSEEFYDRTYLLSKTTNIDNLDLQEKCQYMGGYLAEVDYEEEYDFILGFLRDKRPHPRAREYTLVGVTEPTDGKWVMMTSQLPATFQRWADGQGHGRGNYNCMYLAWGGTEGMHDWPCTDTQGVKRFLCEKPTGQ